MPLLTTLSHSGTAADVIIAELRLEAAASKDQHSVALNQAPVPPQHERARSPGWAAWDMGGSLIGCAPAGRRALRTAGADGAPIE
jgi:hypothetical protein